MQQVQKPYVGLGGAQPDTRSRQFWGELPGTQTTDDYLFGIRNDATANTMRQWAELAFWFPAVSRAVGVGTVSDPGHAVIESIDLTPIGTARDGSERIGSHSYLTDRPIHAVWTGWQQIAARAAAPIP